MPTSCQRARQAGFSFIELLASLAILALMAAVAMPLAEKTVQRSKEHELRRSLRDMRQAIDAYKAAATAGRIEVGLDGSGYPPTLLDLVNGVTDKKNPDGAKLYFLRRLPRDPFFTDDEAPNEVSWGLRSFESPPDAPRSGDDVFDVYSLSEKKGLNGVPYKEW
ncbi:MAG: prepilin-type N-terminal cleavage/methylation domain-containing protein [Chitinimonas sp.]|nr:prepilin-type N-terminal cleavage/methylation domain-containing protein [Chitinimonas sp.]